MGTGYNPAIVTDGLVLSMDPIDNKVYSGSGATVKNRVKNGYDGTLQNGAIVDSTAGGSFELDGSDEVVGLDSNSSYWNNNVFGNATNFSIMCWTKCDNFYNWSSVIHKSNGGYYSQSEGASIWINSAGFQGVFGNGISGNGGDWGNIISYSTSNTTDWFHLAFTGDGTTLRFYVNGSQVGSTSQSSRSAGKNITNNTPRFGVRGGYAYYNGKISAIALYTKALEASQILQNFNAHKDRFGL